MCLLYVYVCVTICHRQYHRFAFCEASPNRFLNFWTGNIKYWTKQESLKIKGDRLSTMNYADVFISEYVYECFECIVNKYGWNENLLFVYKRNYVDRDQNDILLE